jgi:hypothetical protein
MSRNPRAGCCEADCHGVDCLVALNLQELVSTARRVPFDTGRTALPCRRYEGRVIKLKASDLTSSTLPEAFRTIDLDAPKGYEAGDPENVIFDLSFAVGPASSIGGDFFQCVVCTPISHREHSFSSKPLLLARYSFEHFRATFLDVLARCEKDNWYDCLVELRKHFSWEYEGMYDEEDIRHLNA